MSVAEKKQEMIAKSLYPEELDKLICYTETLLEKEAVFPTELQWQILMNHLNEMIVRKKQADLISAIDMSVFSEISQRSLVLAERIAKQIGDLPKAEIYVLSIHFENANQ